jgi:hypothetical protein
VIEPCGGALEGSLEVFGEATVSAQPCEGAFDDPAPWQYLEAFCMVGTLDDLERPLADFGQRLAEFVGRTTAVGEDMAQPREAVADAGEHVGCAVAILDAGGVDDGCDQKALRVGEDMALLPLIFLPAS